MGKMIIYNPKALLHAMINRVVTSFDGRDGRPIVYLHMFIHIVGEGIQFSHIKVSCAAILYYFAERESVVLHLGDRVSINWKDDFYFTFRHRSHAKSMYFLVQLKHFHI